MFYLDGAYSNSHISQSIHHIKQLLNVDAIDTFIVSFNKESSVNEAWKDLEVYQQNGEIHKLGVSDFDCTTLKAFLEREDIKVKPAINQVHVEKCCSLPLDLIQLGKQQDIEMTFNSDTKGNIN